MALPPEQIRIKRRREEEPVETLYIQSQTRESKRRFTDFVFQRIILSQDAESVSGAPNAAESQSTVPGSLLSDKMRDAIHGPRAPTIRVPPSEAEPEQKGDSKESPKAESLRGLISPQRSPARSASAQYPPQSPPGIVTNTVRRFHITVPAPDDLVLHKTGGGVQKKKASKHAVVVEQKDDLIKSFATSGESMASLEANEDIRAEDIMREIEMTDIKSPVSTPRKRRVVNEAEKIWRQQASARQNLDRENKRKEKTGTSIYDDPSTWNHDSAQLVEELEKAAFEAAAPEESSIVALPKSPSPIHSPIKPVLKYQPRLPKDQQNRHRSRAGEIDQHTGVAEPYTQMDIVENSSVGTVGLEDISSIGKALDEHVVGVMKGTDDGSDFVYDIFIRRPLQDLDDDSKFIPFHDGQWNTMNVPADIGVVIISDRDVHYWDALAEDDDEDKDWDMEDEDSNAEDNPANEYPDEDLDLDDEFDDVNAAYSRYRRYGSDDEQFDINDEMDDYDFNACTYGNADACSDNEEMDS